MNSIFSQIIRGDLPCYKVFENDYIFAFLALDQIQLGHTLVVPRVEVDHFADVRDPYYSEIFHSAKILSPAIQEASGCIRVGAMFAGFEVPHCHLHLVPMWGETDLDFKKSNRRSPIEMEEMQKKITENLCLQ